MYEYEGRILKVVDGDTADFELDLGFYVRVTKRLRLVGINTPERHGPEADKAAEAVRFVETWTQGRRLIVRTERDRVEKFGRMLATVLREGATLADPRESLNEELIRYGLAQPYAGGKRI